MQIPLLDSRRLTYVSLSPDGMAPFTSSHILVGHLGKQFAPEPDRDEVFNLKKRWRRVQQLLGQCWKR